MPVCPVGDFETAASPGTAHSEVSPPVSLKHNVNYKQRKHIQLPRVLNFLAPHFQLMTSETFKESVINLKMSRDPCDVHFTKEIK